MSFFPTSLLPSLVESGRAMRFVEHDKRRAALHPSNPATLTWTYGKILAVTQALFYSPYTNNQTKNVLSYLNVASLFLSYVPETASPIMKTVHQVAKLASDLTPLILVTHALALVVFRKSLPHLAFLAFFAIHTAYAKGYFPEQLNKPYKVFSEVVSVAALLAGRSFLEKVLGIIQAHHTLANYGLVDRIYSLPRAI